MTSLNLRNRDNLNLAILCGAVILGIAAAVLLFLAGVVS